MGPYMPKQVSHVLNERDDDLGREQTGVLCNRVHRLRQCMRPPASPGRGARTFRRTECPGLLVNVFAVCRTSFNKVARSSSRNNRLAVLRKSCFAMRRSSPPQEYSCHSVWKACPPFPLAACFPSYPKCNEARHTSIRVYVMRVRAGRGT